MFMFLDHFAAAGWKHCSRSGPAGPRVVLANVVLANVVLANDSRLELASVVGHHDSPKYNGRAGVGQILCPKNSLLTHMLTVSEDVVPCRGKASFTSEMRLSLP